MTFYAFNGVLLLLFRCWLYSKMPVVCGISIK